jgi:ABC-type dipeptide/oligopeptide/nickel transport system permease component
MRHALRRILWIVPALFVISLGSFWLLTGAASFRATRLEQESVSHPLFGAHEPPRFLNSSPKSVRDLAATAVASIAAQDRDAEAARTELARLGGAALPHVLPVLDSLDPKGRARVALALAPVGKRMNVGTADELGNAESAVLFWTRFWQDRAIDFRPAVVKRAVARLAQKSTAGRREDLRQLDTFALSELVAAMGPVETVEDVKRTRRLAEAAARVTELPWVVRKDATVSEARSVVLHWRRWWREHRADYVTFDGPERLLAMVSETQYGHWAAEAAENRLGISANGQPVLDVLRERAPTTAWLLSCGLLGGFGFGIVWGLVGAARARRPIDRVSTTLAVLASALPAPVLVGLLAPPAAGGLRGAVGALVMALSTAAIVSLHQRAATRVALDQEYTRTALAFGSGPWRLACWSFRSSCVATLSLLGAHTAALVTVAFVVEHALGLGGLASVTLLAVTTRDVAWLMALALVLALVTGLVQIGADALLAALDPRFRLGQTRKRGADS